MTSTRPSSSPSPVLTLLGKPDCHLCHEMRAVLLRVLGEGGSASFVETDVTEDPELERHYVFDIPVLLADGREVARHRIGEAELRERLAALGLLQGAR